MHGDSETKMASALSLYLKGEIERRNWDDSDLADRAGLQRSTLSKLLSNPTQIPKLETLSALAGALDVDLGELVALCGFPVSHDKSTQSNNEQIAILLETLPELRGLFDVLMVLRPEDIRAMRAYADGVARRTQKS